MGDNEEGHPGEGVAKAATASADKPTGGPQASTASVESPPENKTKTSDDMYYVRKGELPENRGDVYVGKKGEGDHLHAFADPGKNEVGAVYTVKLQDGTKYHVPVDKIPYSEIQERHQQVQETESRRKAESKRS